MATILFAAAGAALGGGVGGTVLGLSGAVLGRALGATVGRMVDQRIIGLGSDAVEVGKLDRFHIMGASEGAPIPKFWGRMRLPGQVIWASPFNEVRQRSGGKGMPSPKAVQYTYSVSLAIALCEGEILGIGRIWADGDEISPNALNVRTYNGTEDQLPDPLIEAHEGHGLAPAYRGIAYVLIENLELSVFGNRVPQFSFEVSRRGQGTEASKVSDLQDSIRAVALIPGTGEYSLATKRHHEEKRFGVFKTVNATSSSGETDMTTSIRQLRQELPNCKAVSLVVSWFGDDLRCGNCTIQPKVEQKTVDSTTGPWRSGGIGRTSAKEVPRIDGRSIYGGTPADSAVVEAIRASKDNNQSVMFYPFILMDIISGNMLPDPYTGAKSQPTLPWRGRITLSTAPGKDLSPDESIDASSEVSSFFGSAKVSDFLIEDDQVIYSGPSEWKYRRFILHYANICKIAGGVESFCIGSEMRGLTRIRGGGHSFPAVVALIELASDVRSILGPQVKISYAADWSEYFGFHIDQNVYFNLDPLWASDAIDFIGIDNYMPISDWRDGNTHKDSTWNSIYNLEYLKSNISGGEGYDWYYDGLEGYSLQRRLPIVDVAHGEDWVFRYKDIRSWWSNSHYDRIDGVRSATPTGWLPRSKPIRFTEYGCPAIDKGTNEPNKFLDFRSSESMAPRGSLATRDDFIQMQYFRALNEYWNSEVNNPISDRYSGAMLDVGHCYAWAWDVRPYPEFPRNTDAWSDGGNYYCGHWLNGRSTNAPLDRVLREICQDLGPTLIDTTNLYGLLHGYSTVDIQSGRSQIQPLNIAYGFDCIESEGSLTFLTRGLGKPMEISLEEIVVSLDQSPNLEFTRLPDREAVERIRFSHLCADGNFSVQVSESSDIRSESEMTLETEYPMALPMELAGLIADRWLAESRIALDQLLVRLPPSFLSLKPGNLVKIDKYVYRIDRCEMDQGISISAVRTENSLYSSVSAKLEATQWKSTVPSPLLFRLWLDLPLTNSDQSPHSPFLAVSSDPWKGPAVVWSSDEDSGYQFSAMIQSRSLIGRTLSEMKACQSGVLDRGSPCKIAMISGELHSTTDGGLLNGRNLMAIGDGSVEGWELFQFRNADLVDEGIYEISERLRGQFGTEQSIPDIWPSGSLVVMIDSNLQQILHRSENKGLSFHYRISSSEGQILNNSYIYDEITFRNIGLRPYSIVHPRFSVQIDGTHSFRWVRRTRIGGDTWDGYEVPLHEERELYLVSIRTNEGVFVRSFELRDSYFEYVATQRSFDGVDERYFFEVSQISISFGVGPVTKIHINGGVAKVSN